VSRLRKEEREREREREREEKRRAAGGDVIIFRLGFVKDFASCEDEQKVTDR